MNLSDEGVDFISKFEGFSSTIYSDMVGIKTIGFGHVMRPGEDFNNITREQGLDLLKHDANSFSGSIIKLVEVDLEQYEFDALVSFVYNVGSGNFSQSTMLKLLNQGNKRDAADQFPRWDRAGGVAVPGILRRRNAERQLFLTGDYENEYTK